MGSPAPGPDPRSQQDRAPGSKTPPAWNTSWPIIAAVALAIVVAVIGGALEYAGHDSQKLFSFATPLIVALLAIKIQQVGQQNADMRVELNSQTHKLVETTERMALSEGRERGVAAQREQAAAETIALAEARALLQRQAVELETLRAAIPSAPPQLAGSDPVPVHIVADPEHPLMITALPGATFPVREVGPARPVVAGDLPLPVKVVE